MNAATHGFLLTPDRLGEIIEANRTLPPDPRMERATAHFLATAQALPADEGCPADVVDIAELLQEIGVQSEHADSIIDTVFLAVEGAIDALAKKNKLDTEPAVLQDLAYAWAAKCSGLSGVTEAQQKAIIGKLALRHAKLIEHRYDGNTLGWHTLLRAALLLNPEYAETLDIPAGLTPLRDARPLGINTGPQRASFWDPWQEAGLLPEFPLDALPPVLRAVVEDDHKQIGGDLTATAMVYLAAIGAALDDRVEVKVTRHSHWTENPRLWVALIGDPSFKKTPVIDAALVPIKRHNAKLYEAYALAKAAWDDLSAEAKKQQEKPQPECLLTNSATIEALGELLQHNHRGILFHADELAGWIGSMDRYNGSKGGASADRAFWLQAYQGGPHSTHRIGRGSIHVPNLSVSVLGGIQPRLLQTMTDLSVDGLLQRFLPVVMRFSGLGEDRPRNEAALAAYRAHIQRLLEMTGQQTLRLDEAGHALKEAAFQRFHDAMKVWESDLPAFSGFMGKAAGMLMRLALILHFAGKTDPLEPPLAGLLADDRGADALTISAETVRQAIRIMDDCLIHHANALYSEIVGTGRNREHGSLAETRAIASWIIADLKVDQIKMRDLARGPRCCRNVGAQDIERKLDVLVAAGWLTPIPNLSGRREITGWFVAPGLREAFAEQAIAERERKAEVKTKIVKEATAKKTR